MLLVILMNRRLRPLFALVALLSLSGGIALAATSSPGRRVADAGGRPNLVFVLTDDLSMNLLRYMPQVQRLERHGMTFNDYFVSDSLCCPSRSSIFTGNFPHDTGVFNNAGPSGGFHVFHDRGEEADTFAVALHDAGYRTGLMGKYLNGYLDEGGGLLTNVPPNYVPPGWSEWDVGGNGYGEFDYTLNENGNLTHYGHAPGDYLTDVLAAKGADFIRSAAAGGSPFFLELSTFAPHRPYTPPPRYADAFPGLAAPQPPSFDALPTHPPRWLAHRPRLSTADVAEIDRAFRQRVQSAQALDDLLAQIEQVLADTGTARDTYVVFSSDNGLHTGEYRLLPGKMTAFDTDIHVPLIVTGPGITPGSSTDAMTENVDLAKTFAALGGTDLPGDGHSLVPLLHGAQPSDWRNAILVEHHGPDRHRVDPDSQFASGGNPSTYEAMRTHRYLYVEYADGESEYYDLRADPFELHNLAPALTLSERLLLHEQLADIEGCHEGPSCWSAMHVDQSRPALTPRRAQKRLRARRRHHGRGG